MLYCSMLPCHKTHWFSSHHILLFLACFSCSPPLYFCLALWLEDVFLTFPPLLNHGKSSTRPAASWSGHAVVKYFEKWMPQWHHSRLRPVSFYVCSWKCEISKAAENFITLSLPLNSEEHRFWVFTTLPCKVLILWWSHCPPFPSTCSSCWAMVQGEPGLPLIREMYGGRARA